MFGQQPYKPYGIVAMGIVIGFYVLNFKTRFRR